MYSSFEKNIIINLYKNLKKHNIVGEERINFIKNILDVHINTIYNWIKDDLNIYINNDDVLEIIIINELSNNDISFKKLKSIVKEKFKGYVSDKKIKYLIKKNNLKCKTTKITKEIEKTIIDTFLIQKILTATQMCKIILDKYLIKISETSIYSILKKNNITYKNLKVNTNPYSKEEQKNQLLNIKSVIDELDINKIISIDEMSIELDEKPTKGWYIKGQKCIININDGIINKKRLSVVVATSNNKIIDFSIKEKSLSGENFLKFIKKLKRKDNNNEYTYLMDNARIHHTKKLHNYFIKNHMHVLYNAPYYSEINPIENVFSMLRNTIQRSENNNDFRNIALILRDFQKNMDSNKLKNIFEHSFKSLESIINTL